MVPGARTEVKSASASLAWNNPTEVFTAVGGFPLVPGALEIVQKFPRCQREGTPWTANVEPLTSLPIPRVTNELCRDILRLTVSDLKPPGVLNLETVIRATDGTTTNKPMGPHPFVNTTEVVDLPPDFPWDSPDVLAIAITQTHCGMTSSQAQVYRQGGGDPTDGTGPRFGAQLFRCASAIPLDNVFPGSILQVFGPDGAPISAALQASGLTELITVWPPLEEGTVTVAESGCGKNFKITQQVSGYPIPINTPGVIPPVRPGARTVRLSAVLNGATVYIMVNGQIQSSPVQMYDIRHNTVFLWRSVNVNERVTAVQMICDLASTPREGDFTSVTLGSMKVEGYPSTAVRDTTVAFTITARDNDTGDPVTGSITLNGSAIGSTGQPIHYSPRSGDPNPTFTVSSHPAYADKTFSINLVDPVRDWTLTIQTQPIPATISGTNIYINIDSLSFDVVPDWDPSKARTVKPSIPQPNPQWPTMVSTSTMLPIPTGNDKVVKVTISGTATALYPGGASQVQITSDTQTFGFTYSGNNNVVMGWLLMGWSVTNATTRGGVYGLNALTNGPA